jgi:hypothetical protein
MTVSLNARLDEQITPIVAAVGLLLTTTVGDTKYVSMKGYRKCQIVIIIGDGTTVTGSTITLKQATAVAGTSEKALAFSTVYKNVDLSVNQTLTATAVTANTFDTQAVNSKDSVYIIDLDADQLDVAGGFDCFRVDGTGHAATAGRGSVVLYNLYGARYSGLSPVVD